MKCIQYPQNRCPARDNSGCTCMPPTDPGTDPAQVLTAYRSLLAAHEDLKKYISNGNALELRARTAETLDAERYRYLRDAAGQFAADEDGICLCSGLGDLFEYHFGPEVDEVVDAAIARWKALGCPMPKEQPK